MPLMRTDAQWAAALRAMEAESPPRAPPARASNAYIDMATALEEVNAQVDISVHAKEENEKWTPQ